MAQAGSFAEWTIDFSRTMTSRYNQHHRCC